MKFFYLENIFSFLNSPKTKHTCFSGVLAFLLVFFSMASLAQVSEEWVARYNGPGNNREGAPLMAVDAEGNVYVTGASEGVGTGYDYATVKYNPSGEQQWAVRYNGEANDNDLPTAIAIDAGGNVYVTGASENDYATVKYSTSGKLLWVRRYKGYADGVDGAVAIAVDPEGNAYVTGTSSGPGTVADYATVKYNTAGEQQWAVRYSGPGDTGDRHDVARSIAIDAEGNVYVTGTSDNHKNAGEYATVKYNSAGLQQWDARYSGPGVSGQVHSLAVDGGGNIYVTGTYGGDYATIKYNPSGEQQWAARYNGSDDQFDIAWSLAVDVEGNVYVTGSVNNASGKAGDYATVKYNDSGEQQWAQEYSGPGKYTHQFPSLAVDMKGNVYVAGGSDEAATHYDYATIKYNTSGEQQWEERYNGSANGDDVASAIALDAKGNIYVSGRSWGGGAHYDFVTIKYSQQTKAGPIAVDDAYVTDAGVALTVESPGVLSNDTDVDGDALTASLVSEPAKGTLTLNSDGSFVYIPDPCFSGSDSFTYTANDGAEDSNIATVSITVNAVDHALVIHQITAPQSPQQINSTFSISAAITGHNLSSASWDWGDGSSSEGSVNDSEVHGAHSYNMPGIYTITLTLMDGCGRMVSQAYQDVVIQDPNRGFITGGGWFYSPAGAYKVDPAAEGKVNFGFMMKNPKNENVPQGNMVFKFTAGGMVFLSNTSEWLVISGDKAFYKGTGTINGRGKFNFQLTVVDKERIGKIEQDLIRLQIWDSDGSVIYDNQMGAPIYAEPVMALGEGSIIFHRGQKNNKAEVRGNELALQIDNSFKGFSAYPVPLSNDGLWLEFPLLEKDEIFDVLIYDIHGRKMAKKQLRSGKAGSKQLWNLDHQNWPSGIYMLTIRGEGTMLQQKLTK